MLATLAALSTNNDEGKTSVEVDVKQHKPIKAISYPYYDLRRVRKKKSDKSDFADVNKNMDAYVHSGSKLNPFYRYSQILNHQRWK